MSLMLSILLQPPEVDTDFAGRRIPVIRGPAESPENRHLWLAWYVHTNGSHAG